MTTRVSEWDRWCGDDGEDVPPVAYWRKPSQLPTGRELANLRETTRDGNQRDCRVVLSDDAMAYVTTPGIGCPIGVPVPCAGLSDEQAVSSVVTMLSGGHWVTAVEVL